MQQKTTSKAYGWAQSALLCLFAGVYIWHPGGMLAAGAYANISGSIFCAVGIGLLALGLAALGGAVQVEPQPRSGKTLVRRGIYRWLRHPIYTAIVLNIIGLWLKAPYPSIALAGAALIAFLARKVRVEEQFLLEAYPEYAQYRQHTLGMLLMPKL